MNSRNSSTVLLRRTARWCKAVLFGAGLALAGTSNAQVTVTGASAGVNAGSPYATLGAAFTAINGAAQTGNNIVISITGNTTELSSAALNAGAWTTITISPSGGAARTISGSLAVPLIDLAGADNVTFDGLNTGGNSLTIENTNTGAASTTSTFRFITDATSNTITRCSIKGGSTVPTGTNGGTIFFSTAAGSGTGNDNNTISFCDIGPSGANTPIKAIFGNGTTTTLGIMNSGNQILNNNIFDFFSASATSRGILLSTGNTDWTINNNKFYQSAPRTFSSGVAHMMIELSMSGTLATVGNFTISGNTMGFANSSGTGTYSLSGTTNTFRGISVNLSSSNTSASSIQNNTFANISHSTTTSGTTSSSPSMLIFVNEGLVNVGNVTGNTIGSQSATGSITFATTSTSATEMYAIHNFSSLACNVSNNIIGGISASFGATSSAAMLVPIRVFTGSAVTSTITNNTVGGTVANSIQNSNTGTGAQTIGVLMSSSLCTMTGNTIRNLTGAGGTGTTSSASVIGVSFTSTSVNNTVGSNTIHSLSNTHATAATAVLGLSYNSTSGTNLIEKNLIYGLDGGNNANAIVNGILINSGTATYRNNMVRLGTVGNSATAGMTIVGINEAAGTDNFYHNSVYIGGAPTAGASTSFAFQSVVTTNTRAFQNNIFFNARSNSGSTGKHYAIRVGGTAASPAGLTSNYNILRVTGTGSFTGLFNAVDRASIGDWRTATAHDANSRTEDPQYLSPTAATPNLHINPSVASSAEAMGTLVASVTDDYDGQTRSTLTPVDIGADAGNFTTLPLCSGTPATATITGAAAVCSNTGTTLSLSVAYTDLLISYQWRSSTVSGGPYSTTLGTSATQATGNLTVPTYYICEVTCSNGGTFTMTTVQKSVLINALPTMLVNGVAAATGSYCTPGGTAVTLTASGAGAGTYAWSPTLGLSPTSGAVVAASPSTTTTYTVTGTDGNGCVSTATATAAIAVAPNPTGVTATATPAAICTGTTSNLTSTAQTQITTSLANSYTFAGAAGSYTPISGTVLSGATMLGDDVGIGNLPIGFTFNYNGTAETVFAVSSNGIIQLGNTSSTITGFSSNALASTAKVIAGLWDDNNTTGSTVEYSTSGTTPNRVLTVQWTAMHVGNGGNASQPTINMQVKLFESNGAVQIVYGTTSAAFTSTTASIGISGASGNFISVTPLNPANTSTTSTASENTSISAATNFPTGTTYTFTPPQYAFTYAWTPAIQAVSPSTQNTATVALSGSQTFTITVSNGACSTPATTSVTVTPLSCSAATASATRCANTNFTVTANISGGGAPFNYVWSDGVGGVYPNAATITANLPAGSYNFTCAVSDACGGSCNSNATVVVNALPTVQVNGVGAFTGASCNGAGVSLAATGATSYAWSPTAGLTPTSGTPVSAAPTTSTTYTVTGTDGNGCVNTATAAIGSGISPYFLTAAAATPNPVCQGSTTSLTAAAALSTNYTASSIPHAPLTPVVAPTTLCSNGAGTAPTVGDRDDGYWSGVPIGFNFAYFGSSYTSVSIGTNGSVQFGPNLSVGWNTPAVPSTTFSTGSTTGLDNFIGSPVVDMNFSSTAAGSNLLRYWTDGSTPNRKFVVEWRAHLFGISDKDTSQVILYENDGAIEVHVKGFTAMPTTTTTPVIGVENAGGTLGVGAAANRNGTTASWALPSGNEGWRFTPSGASTLTWNPTTSPATGSPVTGTPAISPTTTYTVTASGTGGCTATSSIAVNLTTPPSGTFSYTGSPYCNTGSATVTPVSLTAGGTYSSTAGLSINGSTGAVNLSLSTPGTYTVNYDIAAGGGCPAFNTSASITINAAPSGTFSYTGSPYCNSGSATVTAVSLTGGGTYSSTGGLSINGSTGAVDLALSTPGTYTVNYDIAAGGGCPAFNTSATITINVAPSGTFSYTGSPYCNSGSATVTAVNLTGGGTYSSTGGLSINGSTGAVDLALSTPGTYTVNYDIAAGGGCPAFNASASITINAAPSASVGGPQTICANGTSAALGGNTPVAPATGLWTVFSGGAGTFSDATSPSSTFTHTGGAGPIVLRWTVSNAPCADAVASVTITLNTADSDSDGLTDCLDNCPNFPGVQGGSCDATPGPGFSLGTISNSCTCVPVACTNNVILDLRADGANSSEVGWEILDQNTNLVICSGGYLDEAYPDGISSPITETCCLANGCYRLRVYDQGGDGFVDGAFTGGYQLRESGVNGRRIIDNFGNFINLAGGPPDISAIANTYDNGAFCLPLGNDRPIFSSCDKQDWVVNQYIVATENTAVSAQYGVGSQTDDGYEFWFYDPNGSYSFRRFRNHATSDGTGTGATRACHFRLNGWTNTISTPHLPTNVLLNVRIRGRVNGVNEAFGPACLFKIDPTRASCPLVKLQDNPLNTADYSCGVSRVFGGVNSNSNKLVANPPQFTPAIVASNLRYQFRFRLPGEYPNPGSCIVRPIQLSPTLYLNWTTGDKLKCGTPYQVDLRVSKDGGVTWCVADGEATCSANPTIWGKVCTVSITTSTYCPISAQGGASSLAEDTNGELLMFPNPNRGDQLTLSLSRVEAGVNTVSLDIFDMTGKRVVAQTIAAQDGFLKTTMDLNGDLAGGVYMVNITAGEKTYTQRLVIQP